MRKVHLAIGGSCFASCSGCYCNEIVFKDAFRQEIVPPIRLVQLALDLKISQVTLTGGDPLTYPYLADLLKMLFEKNIFTKVDTTGSLFLRDTYSVYPKKKLYSQILLPNIASYIGMLGLPIDGADEDTFQSFRKGLTLSDTMEILSISECCNIDVCINCVVTKYNIHSLNSIMELLHKYICVKKVQFFQYCSTGRKRDNAVFEISTQDFSSALDELLRMNNSSIIVEGKKAMRRGDEYIFINQFGTAFTPDVIMSDEGQHLNKKLSVLGNICDENGYESLVRRLEGSVSY